MIALKLEMPNIPKLEMVMEPPWKRESEQKRRKISHISTKKLVLHIQNFTNTTKQGSPTVVT